MSEDKIQADIVRWFNNQFCLKFHKPRSLIFAVPNGGSRNKVEANKLKATGTKAGVSDLVVVHGGQVYFIEVKTPTGKQSPSQRERQATIEAQGLIYRVVRSLEEFQEFILPLAL